MLWIIDAFLVALALLLTVGIIRRRALRRRFPPTGAFERIDRHNLHVDVRGGGTPSVVLEAGLGEHSEVWAPVRIAVADFATTLSYDRAGLGWSRGRVGRRTVDTAVDDLHAVISKVELPPPYVLVGHSYGALIMRLFAHRYPDEVAGLVLVDPAHEDQYEQAPPSIRRLATRMRRLAFLIYLVPRLAAWLGLFALRPGLLPAPTDGDSASSLDLDRYRGVIAAHGTRPFRAALAELQGLDESFKQLRSARGPLGNVPVVVIAHDRPAPLPASISVADQEANEQQWRSLQQEVAEASDRGRVLVATDAGHAVHLEQPGLVVEAIRDIIAEVTSQPVRRAPRRAPAVDAQATWLSWMGRIARALLGLSGRLVRGVATVAAVIFVLAMAGATFETVTASGDAAAYPPPGRLIDVGGHRLHLHCKGDGGPTVVIDAGGGDFSQGWSHIQTQIAKDTRICTYDRGGHGWSEPGRMPRTADRVVDDLHALLAAADEEPPYVLVGASMSARYVRLYAATYPGEVAGIVIADGRHESFDAYLGADFMARGVDMNNTMVGIQRALRSVGVVRAIGPQLMGMLYGPGFDATLGSAARSYALHATADPHLDAYASEVASWTDANRRVADQSLGGLPLVVLAHGKPLPDANQEGAWQAAQEALAGLSSRGELRVVAESGHGIQMDAPDAVQDAIGDVVAAARAVAGGR